MGARANHHLHHQPAFDESSSFQSNLLELFIKFMSWLGMGMGGGEARALHPNPNLLASLLPRGEMAGRSV